MSWNRWFAVSLAIICESIDFIFRYSAHTHTFDISVLRFDFLRFCLPLRTAITLNITSDSGTFFHLIFSANYSSIQQYFAFDIFNINNNCLNHFVSRGYLSRLTKMRNTELFQQTMRNQIDYVTAWLRSNFCGKTQKISISIGCNAANILSVTHDPKPPENRSRNFTVPSLTHLKVISIEHKHKYFTDMNAFGYCSQTISNCARRQPKTN